MFPAQNSEKLAKLLFKQTRTGFSASPPLLSSVINSPAGSAVSSRQERRCTVSLDSVTELILGCKFFISLDIFTSQTMNNSIKIRVLQVKHETHVAVTSV